GGEPRERIARHGQGQRNALAVERLGCYLRPSLGETRLEQGQFGVSATAGHGRRVDNGNLGRQPQALRRAASVGAHESARAELHAAEPAYDEHGYAIEPLPFDGLQYGTPGGSARLAIIIESIGLPDAICPAIVGGGRIAAR